MTGRLGVIGLLAALLCGCGSLQPYETRGGSPTRLEGTKTSVKSLTVAEALRLHRHDPVYVRGYLLAPADDVMRLCARLNDYADCRGAPAIVLDAANLDLSNKRALHEGCCANGYWSPRPVVLRVQFKGVRRAVVRAWNPPNFRPQL